MTSQPEPSRKIWRRTDSLRILQITMIGVALGISFRWMDKMAATLPVLAAEGKMAPGTNAPPLLRTEGVSPSGRD